MTDRIVDVWGERTPIAAGEHWPQRVDQFLTVDEDRVERWVQSACVLCSNGCGMDMAVAGGRITGVRGRAVDRVNRGRLGPKGLYGWQANHSPDRLTRPLVRTGGQLRETDWDTAMTRVTERSRQVIDEHGRLAMAFYTSGQLFTEEYYTQCVIARGGIGTRIWTAIPGCARRRRSGRWWRSLAAMAIPAPTPTSTRATPCSWWGITWPRRRP